MAPVTGDSVSEASAENLDEMFTLAASRRRQAIIVVLFETDDGVIGLEKLAEEVRKLEAERMVRDVPPRSQIANDLHHLQLPKLADAGILEYNSTAKVIRYQGHDLAEEFLEIVHTHSLDKTL